LGGWKALFARHIPDDLALVERILKPVLLSFRRPRSPRHFRRSLLFFKILQ